MLKSERISVKDSIETVSRMFYRRGWTDGLPIIPPTEERVEAMLEYSDREPDEVLGLVPPKYGEASVEKMAINAVMAGCFPEYFPVVVTAIQAMLEEEFNLYGIQATTHSCAPLVIVNGPMAEELDINSGYNIFGQGWMANAAIGRAVRLILTNVGGGVPGVLDRSTMGSPGKYSFCVAENEEASPWEPYHVERGFPREASTVTVVGGESPHNINDHIGTRPETILAVVASSMSPLGSNDVAVMGRPFLFLGPEHAAIAARAGWSKDDVKAFIFEHARNPKRMLKIGGMYGLFDWPSPWNEAGDDDMIPIARCKEDIHVLVGGGPGRHSACIHTFGITSPVTKPIALKGGSPAASVKDFRGG